MSAIQFLSIPFASPAYDEMVALRQDILRTPLGLSFTVPYFKEEYAYHHLVAYTAEQELVACLVLVPKGEGQVKMIQVAVKETRQRQGIGQQLVVASEELARSLGFTEMILHAREVAIPFYKKMNYETIGEPFTEVGILHAKMRKLL